MELVMPHALLAAVMLCFIRIGNLVTPPTLYIRSWNVCTRAYDIM
jgi:hypothetical protein